MSTPPPTRCWTSVRAGNPRLLTVAGLPDGGAVAAGRDIVIERDRPARPGASPTSRSPARPRSPPPRSASSGAVRAVVSVVPQLDYPAGRRPAAARPERAAADPAALRACPATATCCARPPAAGRTSSAPPSPAPARTGRSRATRPWRCCSTPPARLGGRRLERLCRRRRPRHLGPGGAGSALRARVRTAAISRFGPGAASAPNGATLQPLPMPAGPVRFAVAGNAQCEERLRRPGPAVDRPRPHPQRRARHGARCAASGARGRCSTPATGSPPASIPPTANATRRCSAREPGLPVFPALGSDDVGDGRRRRLRVLLRRLPGAVRRRRRRPASPPPGSPAPLPARARAPTTPSTAAAPGGTVRVIVIDNSRGSLAASDPYQNPAEAQLPWLEAVLADARAKGSRRS